VQAEPCADDFISGLHMSGQPTVSLFPPKRSFFICEQMNMRDGIHVELLKQSGLPEEGNRASFQNSFYVKNLQL
jgi:hypothetical protein